MVRVIAYVWNMVLLLLARLFGLSPLKTALFLLKYGMCDGKIIRCREEISIRIQRDQPVGG